ncbi:hypothetical protein [Streptomyces tremellae]|uniref:F5/8 type C domain-containing protein n=1 Tax=Streptomyces tremellae TaxID=1124239 RepID=A0ABP7EGQ4_9ACTN
MKQSGLGDHLYVSGHDLSGDIGQVNRVGGGPATLDVTSIVKEAFERIGGVRDGGIDYTSFFNPSNGPGGPASAHEVLSTLPYGDRLMTYVRGATLGGPVAQCVAKQLNYDGTRADDGAFTFAGSTQGNGFGLEWCNGLTAGQRTDTEPTDGDTVDLDTITGVPVSGAFGLQAYLHVFALDGDSLTVTLQESADGDTWTDVVGGHFDEATDITSQRIETARDQAVQRYLRASTAGDFTSAVIAVAVNRNEVEVQP